MSASKVKSALSEPLFRSIWIAAVFSQVGVWVQDIGANWVMTELTASPLRISMLQVALSVPTFLVALPAGVISDIFSKRKVLLIASSWMLVIATLLSLLTLTGVIGETSLLGLIFLYGIGNAFYNPAWQATVPEIVSEEGLVSAIALNSSSINIARAIGPAIGGLLISLGGPYLTMLFNALSFLGLMFLLFKWEGEVSDERLPKERFSEALKVGLRFVTHSKDFRIVLMRTSVFLFFGSALWALLPYVLKTKLGYTAGEFGLSMGTIGAGALISSLLLTKLRNKIGVETVLVGGTIFIAAALYGLSQITNINYMLINLLFAGAGWITVISSMHTASIMVLPRWVRGRALSVYNLIFFGSLAIGSASWGFLANSYSSDWTLTVVAIGMLLSVSLSLISKLPQTKKDLTSAAVWPSPHTHFQLPNDVKGIVRVEIHYKIETSDISKFIEFMKRMKIIRRSEGGFHWDILQHAESPNDFYEIYSIDSWAQHIHQHERFSKHDRELEQQIHKLHVGDSRPEVRHLISSQYRKF